MLAVYLLFSVACFLTVHEHYNRAFIAWNYGESSAAAMILFLILGLLTILQFRMEKKWVSYM